MSTYRLYNLLITTLLLVISSCTKPANTTVDIEQGQGETTRSIAHLKSSYHSGIQPITDNITIEGTIIGNDIAGEFQNMIIIEDETAGIEILIKGSQLYNKYHYGQRVEVTCSGLALGNSGGRIQLGTLSLTDNSLTTITLQQADQHIRAQEEVIKPTPLTLSIRDLTTKHISTLARFENLQFPKNSPETLCLRDSITGQSISTTHILRDPMGDSIELFVNGRCDYAQLPTPRGAVTVHAIVNYFDGEFSLNISNSQIVSD